MSTKLTAYEKQEIFGSFDPDVHNEEVKSRWGNTDAYKQSAKKTANYTKEDMSLIHIPRFRTSSPFCPSPDSADSITTTRV